MRAAAAQAWIDLCRAEPQFIFLTGDLGFRALESVREAAGPRFINAGVAEQNMISVAAGLAHQGFKPWAYSIAPFAYARPFEQIRNDVCFHRLPVKIVGNGGGYAYGVMGATHHALEDYGVLGTFPGMNLFVPCFDEDLKSIIPRMNSLSGPAYLRLGLDEKPSGYLPPTYQACRKLLDGHQGVLLTVGPLATSYLGPLLERSPWKRPELWALSHWSSDSLELPPEFLTRLSSTTDLILSEEHVPTGSLAERISLFFMQNQITPRSLKSAHARGYPSGKYGSQSFHRKESGLDLSSVLNEQGSVS